MDKIKLESIEFYAYHGVFESEKKQGQVFSVDCEMEVDTSSCGDNIYKTVNYGDVALDIRNFSISNKYDLLETMVNDLAKFLLLKYDLVKSIELIVHKPNAPIPVRFSDVSVRIKRERSICYLAICSNLGDREANLDLLSKEIKKDSYIKEMKKSTYIETKPYGILEQSDFLNAVVKIETIYTPYELLKFCKKVEKKSGRKTTRKLGERTLDVDILIFGDKIIFEEDLKIPHPEMHIRENVLKSLEEIEPYLVHPIKKLNILEMIDLIKDND
ncbi:2-amino-4-hydroxy-6-hydroxymethyldihydropteridine diphosphokinase [Peptostreptococcus canis]|uniref:Bifunctional folate synthesis protein n=1 Tax=Peptostreptococcus canis TaxID=1159213 RepID=A0ABR6TLB9_9FIRM|nr:2-amino-4-hydroxy-6-hydroxymethyldihydropteridine diphosphokinase [Peptostreptococcus canis]MBC2576192.1 2-amino-4-hydroxy-6-hydroxymethyldihydropteridine diphosphokinase [Peptostreptococcus canis]MBP1998273.1 dihydroneopterin aldolase/2-amino-4-hydroxy-6-hydroxymethyldihydropteridine diphosphokinase [Peptostreptococcus canis]